MKRYRIKNKANMINQVKKNIKGSITFNKTKSVSET